MSSVVERLTPRADRMLLPVETTEAVWRAAEVLCDLDHDNPVDSLPCKRCLRTAQRDILLSQQRQLAAIEEGRG